MRKNQLREENRILTAAIEEARKQLIQLEWQEGIKQIPVPNRTLRTTTSPQLASANAVNDTTNLSQNVTETANDTKPKKEKKPKETKQKLPTSEEPPIDIGRLDLRIAKVEDVQKHPDADSLYVLKINCGDDKPRTVCSGLVKHIPIDDVKNKTVLLLCNLKPVKVILLFIFHSKHIHTNRNKFLVLFNFLCFKVWFLI